MSLNTMHESYQISVILICKNSLVRAGIRHILNNTRFIVAGEIENTSELPHFANTPPALYILDESYSADALAEAVAELKAQSPSARVVVFADHLNPKTIMQALQAGMDGVCSTRMEHNPLIKALELVMLGETFIPAALALTTLNEMSHAQGGQPNTSTTLTPANNTATATHNLSRREAEILRRLMEGESNKMIARKLDIAEATIKVHVKTILRKVQAKNRTQAAMWAAAHLSDASGGGPVAQGQK